MNNDHRIDRIRSQIGNRLFTIDIVDEIMIPYENTTSYNPMRAAVKSVWYDVNGKTKDSFSDIEWYFFNKQDVFKKSRSKVARYITQDHVDLLIGKSRSKRQELFIRFLSCTGMRISEMCNVLLTDISYHTGFAEIEYEALKTKNSVVCRRIVDIDMIEQILTTFSGKKYLFETSGGKPYNRGYVWSQIQKLSKEVIGFGIGCHTFRHFWSTMQHNMGVDPFKVSRDMGHKNIGSRYTNYYHKIEKVTQ